MSSMTSESSFGSRGNVRDIWEAAKRGTGPTVVERDQLKYAYWTKTLPDDPDLDPYKWVEDGFPPNRIGTMKMKPDKTKLVGRHLERQIEQEVEAALYDMGDDWHVDDVLDFLYGREIVRPDTEEEARRYLIRRFPELGRD